MSFVPGMPLIHGAPLDAMTLSRADPSKNPLPGGREFFEVVSKVETVCAIASLKGIPGLGINTPACYASLGDVLSMLYAEAACSFGCAGGDHFWQKLTARIVSHSLASLRLALSGYYDESLALTRGVGEIANLLFLFAAKPELVKFWHSSDDKHRKKHFGPVKVRLAIEELGHRPPIDESRYSLLCEVGVHLVPSVSPQAFSEHDRPTLGATYRDGELMVTLNELSNVVAESAACISTFSFVGSRSPALLVAAQVLLNAVGNFDLKVAKEFRPNGV